MDAVSRFSNPRITADGAPRAHVALQSLDTLWFNTGTLCNLTCANCYIESSPSNDLLVYLSLADVEQYLDEIEVLQLGTRLLGFTGGEPFMNPDFVSILASCLARGFECLVLTNAMRPMMKCADGLLALHEKHAQQLELRVSVDHFDYQKHETERGSRSWAPTQAGIKWLNENGFKLSIAGRTQWGESVTTMRAGFAGLFASWNLDVDVCDEATLVVFPEMDESAEVPEITQACWGILNKSPNDLMCSNARMIVRRKGAVRPSVVACTLLPYDEQFELGPTLEKARQTVSLNHPHCAKFCVLGGGACSV